MQIFPQKNKEKIQTIPDNPFRPSGIYELLADYLTRGQTLRELSIQIFKYSSRTRRFLKMKSRDGTDFASTPGGDEEIIGLNLIN